MPDTTIDPTSNKSSISIGVVENHDTSTIDIDVVIHQLPPDLAQAKLIAIANFIGIKPEKTSTPVTLPPV